MRSHLHNVADKAADFLESLPHRRVGVLASHERLLAALDKPLLEESLSADSVLNDLACDVDLGLIASAGPRYFGFVIGGTTPTSLAADWLTSAWDQNAQVYATSPAAAIVEEIVARWLIELLELPTGSSVGFLTGCQMANFTALNVARNSILARAGWEIDENGLFGAPPFAVFMSDQAHSTIKSALRMNGIGSAHIHAIPSDDQGRMQLDELQNKIKKADGQPIIISVQAGNVNTGAFEPIDAIADIVKGQNAWIHVDGAFGLWAAVSPKYRYLLKGLERADSWSTDAHKWLNVPYDSGIVVIKRPADHHSLKTARCAYAGMEVENRRDGSTWAPENSRRARAFVLYATIRSLGRSGIRHGIERCCDLSQQFAAEAALLPNARILNEVVLNQLLLRFEPPNIRDTNAFHEDVARQIQSNGLCWIGGTQWKDKAALRISVTNWSTEDKDVFKSVQELSTIAHRLTTQSMQIP